jgi:hypothetical protein
MAMKPNPWQEYLFRPLATAVMFGCIAQSLADLIHLLDPQWNGTVLVVGSVLAALEAGYSYRLTRSEKFRGRSLLRFRVIELALFFILLKITGLIGKGWADALVEIRMWPHNPATIVDSETLLTFLFAAGSWWASIRTARDLERISEPPEVSRYYTPPRESLANRFFIGGVAILALSGLSRIGIAYLWNLERPPVPGLVLNVLIYFLLGLVMLGQVQLATLHKQWQARSAKIDSGLDSRWLRYGLVFIGLAALVAFLLPTGYTMGLLGAVGNVLDLVVGVLWFVVKALIFIVALLLWLLLYLLSLLTGRTPPTRPSLSPPEQVTTAPSGTPLSWFEVLRSLVFWAVALGMITYVVRTYLRDHPEILQSLARFSPLRALFHFLAALWRGLSELVETVGERIPRRLPSRLARGGFAESTFRFFRLGGLAFRERILYYYLSILKRAGQQGYPRYHAQTPREYDAALEPHLPQAQEEMALLTEAFLEARYSQHPIDHEYARRVQDDWERVKAALRALKRKKEESAEETNQ